MEKMKYLAPEMELMPIVDILTESDNVPDFEEDENELPKLDW